MTTIGTLASIHRFPVKSMQGEALGEVTLDENGMVGDRTWALRDVETGKLVSAKRPRLWRAMLDCTATGTGDEVVVGLPTGDRFPIDDPGLPGALGSFLGRQVTIEASTGPRQGTYESDWPEIEGIALSGEIDFPTNLTGDGTSFIDLGILHVLATASLDALAAVGPPTAADVRRFRPGLLFDTPDLAGFVEAEWTGRTLHVGEVEMLIGDPSPRCIMTTVAQGDLGEEKGVLTALATNNRIENAFGGFACLGSYASVTRPGAVRAGDPVELA